MAGMTEGRERVLAIDPGERVGWAHATMGENHLEITGQGVSALKPFAVRLHERQILSNPGYDVLVYETWRLRPSVAKAMIGNDMQPAQLVGMIRLCGWASGARLQGYGPDRKEVAMASMPPEIKARFDASSEQHDKDALMHLWLFYFENHFDPTQEPA